MKQRSQATSSAVFTKNKRTGFVDSLQKEKAEFKVSNFSYLLSPTNSDIPRETATSACGRVFKYSQISLKAWT